MIAMALWIISSKNVKTRVREFAQQRYYKKSQPGVSWDELFVLSLRHARCLLSY